MIVNEPLNTKTRIRISDSTRVLLLHFASGDDEMRLPHVRANWGEVLEATARHGLIPLAARLLARQATDGYPPHDVVAEVQGRYRATAVSTMWAYRRIARLLVALSESGPEFIALKGPILGASIYPDPSLRVFHDLDLLVGEKDWAVMDETLRDLGFIPESDLPAPPPKLTRQAVPHEHKYLSTEDGFLVEVHYDDVLHAGLAARGIEGFWKRAVTVDIEGTPVRTLCPEDQLIYLCSHIHHHGYTRLSWFTDLAFLLRRNLRPIDWQQLISTTREEDAGVAVYYTLQYLRELLRVSVPCHVLSAVRPDALRRWAHRMFLPDEKVLSMQPMTPPTLSFYFIPVFTRLIPDLLVMGRRKEKLRYLLRLLVPPREWLVHYYSLDPSRHVLIHYLLHPLKLLCHTGGELADALSRLLLTSIRRMKRILSSWLPMTLTT
jgi:hypothetical protein